MPLYEYACSECGRRFEVRQGIREEPLTTCPTCEGAIRRVIQPVGIVFKGSGFYKTDSRSSSEASVPAGEKAEKKDEAPAAAATSEGAGASGTAATGAANGGTAPSSPSGTSTGGDTGGGAKAPATKPAPSQSAAS